MDLFNQMLDLYWTTEVLLGKVIVERGEMKRHMGVIRANLIPLCSFCYHLRTIEAKQNLVGNYVGLIFRVCNTNDVINPPEHNTKIIDLNKDEEEQQITYARMTYFNLQPSC